MLPNQTFNKKVLDHGYVRLIESYGSDERIIEAARMSTNKGFLGWGGVEICAECQGAGALGTDSLYLSYDQAAARKNCKMCDGTGKKIGDEKLLKFLWNHAHHTPFEMAGMIIEVQAPIMVFREWHRHRTQSYNELSARYTPLPDVNYIPTAERCLMVSGTNRQAGRMPGSGELTHEQAIRWLEMLSEVYDHAQRVYNIGLELGIPKEIARLPVPVGRYSRMRASANLRNWLGFLTLRLPENAQWEIRQYSNIVSEVVQLLFPRTHELFAAKMRQ